MLIFPLNLSTPSVNYVLPICVTDEIDQIWEKLIKKPSAKTEGLMWLLVAMQGVSLIVKIYVYNSLYLFSLLKSTSICYDSNTSQFV